MSLLAEVSKTVVNATVAFTSSSAASTGSSSSLASAARAQPYVQVGAPVAIPDSIQGSFCWGSFDGATTTFAYPVVLASGAAAVHIYANGAAAGSPPNFSLAATLPVAGTVGVFFFAMTQLSSNGRVCVFGSNYNNGGDGIVAVFTRPSTSSQTWTQVATVNGSTGSGFGEAVSISADGAVIAVGVFTLNGGVGGTNVYAFNAATGTLTLVATVVGTGALGLAFQGYSAAVSGDGATLAVGGEADNAGYGAVWMFKNVNGTWTQMGSKLAPYNATPVAFVGAAVALSYDGTRLAVASTGNALAQNSGSVFMYDLVDGVSWVQGQTIYPLLTSTQPSIYSIALSDDGNVLVFDEFNYYNENEGAVFVYNRLPNGLWVQNGEARIGTGALLFPSSNAGFYLGGTSRTGSMFAMVNTNSTAPGPGPVAFAVFQ